MTGTRSVDRRKRLRAVVFDCDGVLFDSAAANLGFFDAALAAAGLPALDARGRQLALGYSTHQLVEALYTDEDVRARLRAAAQALDYTPFYGRMRPMDGLYDILARLRGQYVLGMATNRGTTVHGVMQRFGLVDYIRVAVGVLDVKRPKPDPAMLLECVARLGTVPAEAVYVGDQEGDRRAAEAAGMPFIGVGATAGGPIRIDDLVELPDALLRLEREAEPDSERAARANAASGR